MLYYTGIPDRQIFHSVVDELKDKETVASRESYMVDQDDCAKL